MDNKTKFTWIIIEKYPEIKWTINKKWCLEAVPNYSVWSENSAQVLVCWSNLPCPGRADGEADFVGWRVLDFSGYLPHGSTIMEFTCWDKRSGG